MNDNEKVYLSIYLKLKTQYATEVKPLAWASSTKLKKEEEIQFSAVTGKQRYIV